MMDNLRKLTLDEYILLENLMDKVPDPNEIYTATGWHYELMALLSQFGYRPLGRIDAWNLAWKLLEIGYEHKT